MLSTTVPWNWNSRKNLEGIEMWKLKNILLKNDWSTRKLRKNLNKSWKLMRMKTHQSRTYGILQRLSFQQCGRILLGTVCIVMTLEAWIRSELRHTSGRPCVPREPGASPAGTLAWLDSERLFRVKITSA